eukprot:TRINITY_DN10345_c0_g1_i1.p1 TRINITY_DN10345_c0_g1~~TRINITY_DN10345_c0_g1_i1.p1  ORF type:complete len:218 (-),score=55.97 TRINITY_DN10345_c0_g1_i1:113-766(-)
MAELEEAVGLRDSEEDLLRAEIAQLEQHKTEQAANLERCQSLYEQSAIESESAAAMLRTRLRKAAAQVARSCELEVQISNLVEENQMLSAALSQARAEAVNATHAEHAAHKELRETRCALDAQYKVCSKMLVAIEGGRGTAVGELEMQQAAKLFESKSKQLQLVRQLSSLEERLFMWKSTAAGLHRVYRGTCNNLTEACDTLEPRPESTLPLNDSGD